jgi:hypothetical protein
MRIAVFGKRRKSNTLLMQTAVYGKAAHLNFLLVQKETK